MEAESQMSNDKKKLKVYIFGYRPSVSNSFTKISKMTFQFIRDSKLKNDFT